MKIKKRQKEINTEANEKNQKNQKNQKHEKKRQEYENKFLIQNDKFK